jgi:hypothetical protein
MFDAFGQPVQLNFEGQTHFRSIYGSLATITFLALLVYLSLPNFLDALEGKITSIS